MSDTPPPAAQDLALPFLLHRGAFRGRLVRLDATTTEILTRHAYPPPVARLVAEAAALATALAFALKFDGVFTLQVQGDGPVRLLVADVTSGGAVRAYARFDAEAVATLAPDETDTGVQRLLGAGHLAFTVDLPATRQGDGERYQGIVALEGATLADCVHQYFRQSEQLDTAIKVASTRAESGSGSGSGSEDGPWRAAALMLQRMPVGAGGHADPGLDPEAAEDAWRTAVVFLGSLTDGELLDRALTPETVLLRLFHEAGPMTAPAIGLAFGCRCSRARVDAALATFPAQALDEMRRADGSISAHCEFCSTEYILSAAEVDALTAAPPPAHPSPASSS